MKIEPIRIGFDVADPTMWRTVFHEKFSSALRNSPFHVADPRLADIRFASEDIAMETNWPRFGNPDSVFIRGAFDKYQYSRYLKRLVESDTTFCVLSMNPINRLPALLSSCRHLLVADINLCRADRARNPRTISMPAPPFVTGSSEGGEKPLLASFRGAASHLVRVELAKLARPGSIVVELTRDRQHAGVIDAENEVVDDDYAQLLRDSTFAFVPRGDYEFSYRLLEVMSFGCIPIVISDGLVLPFDRLIDWRECSLTVPEARVADIPDLLAAMDSATVDALRAAAERVYRVFLANFDKIAHSLIAELSIIARLDSSLLLNR